MSPRNVARVTGLVAGVVLYTIAKAVHDHRKRGLHDAKTGMENHCMYAMEQHTLDGWAFIPLSSVYGGGVLIDR